MSRQPSDQSCARGFVVGHAPDGGEQCGRIVLGSLQLGMRCREPTAKRVAVEFQMELEGKGRTEAKGLLLVLVARRQVGRAGHGGPRVLMPLGHDHRVLERGQDGVLLCRGQPAHDVSPDLGAARAAVGACTRGLRHQLRTEADAQARAAATKPFGEHREFRGEERVGDGVEGGHGAAKHDEQCGVGVGGAHFTEARHQFEAGRAQRGAERTRPFMFFVLDDDGAHRGMLPVVPDFGLQQADWSAGWCRHDRAPSAFGCSQRFLGLADMSSAHETPMTTPFPSFLTLALGLGAAAASAAQDPALAFSSPRGDERVPIHTAAADRGYAYGLWAAGELYKASFHDGAVFVPYLGREYQAPAALRWRTEAAQVGGQSLLTQAPNFGHGTFRAEFDHGGVVEAYDVRGDGLEQTFVLRQRPAANGDLVIRGRVESTLKAAARTAAHAAVDFADAAGQPIVRYGAAMAIDARGATAPMTTAIDGDRIELRLDAEWLAAAEFPLVVDPLLATIYANSSGNPVGEIDLLHDEQGNSGKVWLASERWASATDCDLRLRRFDDDGANATLVFSDITASWSAAEPSLGNHEYAQRTLLAFTRHFGDDTRRLRFHTHNRASFVLSTAAYAVSTGDFNVWRPDVATDYAAGAPDTLLVVFQRETDLTFFNSTTSSVYGSLIDVALDVANAPFAIASNGITDNERPTVGKLRVGGAGTWTVAYQSISTPVWAGSSWDVVVRRVDRNETVTAPYSIGSGVEHEMAPRLGGDNGSHVLVYVRSSVADAGAKPAGSVGHTVVSRRVDWNGASFSQPYPGMQLESAPDARLVLTGIDRDRTTGSHYALTYRSTVTENVYLEVLGYRGHALGETLVFDALGNDASLGGAVTYDEDNERFLLGYSYNIPGLGLEHVAPYIHPSAPAPVSSGIGCGTGQLSWLGSQWIGDGSVSVRMTNAPAGAIATVLFATSTASLQLFGLPPVVDGCWLLVPTAGPDYLGFVDPQFGPNATWTFPLPESLSSFTLRLQGVHFDATNTQVLTTARLSVPLVK